MHSHKTENKRPTPCDSLLTLYGRGQSGKGHPYPIQGSLDLFDKGKVRAVQGLLEGGCFRDVPPTFFGWLYDKNLANLVVYLNRDSVAAVLVKNNKVEKRLRGDSYLWVMVFSAQPIAAVADTTKEDKIENTTPAPATATKSAQVRKNGKATTAPTKAPSNDRKQGSAPVATPAAAGVTVTEQSGVKPEVSSHATSTPDTVKSTRVIKYSREAVFVKHESLEHQLSPAEAVIAAVGTAISGLGLTSPKPPGSLSDSTYAIRMRRIGGEPKKPLYFGMQKIPMHENTINRVSIGSAGLEDLSVPPADTSRVITKKAYATFGNYSGSWIAISLGAGATLNAKSDSTTYSTQYDPYLFGHLYIKRPKLPQSDSTHWRGDGSLSLVVGTRVGGDTHFLDDPVLGVGVGHIIGSIGLVAGCVFRSEETAIKDKKTGKTTGKEINRNARLLLAASITL